MSYLRYNSITSNYTKTTTVPEDYVCTVLKSADGPENPVIVTSLEEFVSLFGVMVPNFYTIAYILTMVKSPLLVYSSPSLYSDYNHASIRISKWSIDNNTTYEIITTPRSNVDYSKKDHFYDKYFSGINIDGITTFNRLNSGEAFFTQIIDLRLLYWNDDQCKSEFYFLVPIPNTSYRGLFSMTHNDDQVINILPSSNNYIIDDSYIIGYSENNTRSTIDYSINNLISKISDKLGDYIVSITTVYDQFVELSTNYINNINVDQITSHDIILGFVKQLLSYPYPRTIKYDIQYIITEAYYEALETVEDAISKDPNSLLNTVAKRIYAKLKKDYLDKIILLTFNNPVPSVISVSSNEVKVDYDPYYTQEILNYFFNDSKILEFHAKSKGTAGNLIKLSIQHYTGKDKYDIKVTNDFDAENYTVRLGSITAQNTNLESINIINQQSSLITVDLFNYLDESGDLVNDAYLENEPIDDRKKELAGAIINSYDLQLSNGTYEYVSEKDYAESYKKLIDYEWYPNYILVNDVEELSTLNTIIDVIKDSGDGSTISSQALVNLSKSFINKNLSDVITTKSENPLPNKGNRVLYFYGDILVDNYKVKSYAAYLSNILTYNFLGEVSGIDYIDLKNTIGGTLAVKLSDTDNIKLYTITNISSGKDAWMTTIYNSNDVITNDGKVYIGASESSSYKMLSDTVTLYDPMEILDYMGINYLYNDNNQYYYSKLSEALPETSSFIIRSIISKYKRYIYSLRHNLIGLPYRMVSSKLEAANNHLQTTSDLISSSTIDIARSDQDTIDITIMLTIQKLVNKTYKLNITINNSN